jgi:hypothetical protein
VNDLADFKKRNGMLWNIRQQRTPGTFYKISFFFLLELCAELDDLGADIPRLEYLICAKEVFNYISCVNDSREVKLLLHGYGYL